MIKYYKILILTAFTFFYSQNIRAQVDSVKTLHLKNKLIDSICICISKTDTNSVNNIQDAQGMLTRCITSKMDLYVDYVTAAGNGMSNISEEKIQEIATYIASEVNDKCPAMKIMINHVKSKLN